MSTTDILFNSPALHSLKRAQLVQLCKRHNIKASGKNTELVARLKEHARGLPSGTPLSVAVRSETEPAGYDGEKDEDAGMMTDISDECNVEEQLTSPTRETDSQLWEIVSRGSIDSKRSVATTATRNQPYELGLASNQKSTILRSIASSIGLARSPSANSIPTGESSDSLAPNTSKRDRDHPSSSPKARSIFSSLMPRSRSNSHESQTKPNNNNNKEDARKSLLTHAIPYNQIPVPSVSRRPQVEPFAFSYAGKEDTSLGASDVGAGAGADADVDVSMTSLDRPVPGVGPCFSVNASDGVGTVRLITSTNKPPKEDEEDGPKLTPVIPAFDLIPPTPGKTGLHRFPVSATPEMNRTLYPKITADDMSIDLSVLTSPSKKPSMEGMEVDKSLPSLPELSPVSPTNPKEPFVFGSPNPRHSTTPADFTNAASSVLAEMNARLGAVGGRAIDSNLLAHTSGMRSKLDVDALLKYEFGGAQEKSKDNGKGGKEGSVSKKFEKLHEKAFSKMDGIDTHYAAKRSLKDKEKEKLEPLPDNRKRKQSVLRTRKSTAPAPAQTKKNKAADKISEAGPGKKTKKTTVVIPGAFETDEMDVDESLSRIEVSEEYEHEQPEPEPEPAPETQQGDSEEDNERGTKRACVAAAEPTADGAEPKRISIALSPKMRKAMSDEGDEEVDEEKKRKQSEAIKRRLELNKARRRSSRGRPSTAPRTPIQKQKGFLASAKSFVKSVWTRGGNPATAAKTTNTSGPSYLRATASSTSKASEQETKPVSVLVLDKKPPIGRASSVRSSSVRSAGLARKASGSQKPSATGTASSSVLETVAEADAEKGASQSATEPHVQTTQPAPILGSVKPRKPSAAVSLARKPSGNGASNTGAASIAGRSASRLLAPTASSLAKVNASPTKPGAPLRAKVPSIRACGSVLSPSKIPIFSPPHRNNHGVAPGTPSGKRIFGAPLMLPSSPQTRSAAEKGHDINPITGAVTPQRTSQRAPFSSANGQTQSFMGAATALKKDADAEANKQGEKGKEKEQEEQNGSPAKVNKVLNSLHKPRISRSKVIARLGTHRERVGSPASPGSPRAPLSPVKTASANAGESKVPATPKVRSSTGVAARRSIGGPKARDSGASAVILSAKKRARTTEYARRKSAKTPLRGPDFSKVRNGVAMEIDD